MQDIEYKKMYELEDSYWWYVGRRAVIRSVIKHYCVINGGIIVDVGCGTGTNLGLLGEFSKTVIGLDTAPQAIAYCAARGFRNTKLIDNSSQLPFQDGSVELVTLLDVLEHVENESKTLSEVWRILNRGGTLLLTLPAYQFLWSEHDIALHHFRRYTASRIRELLEKNGFSIVKCSYVIVSQFPIILAYRIVKGILNIFIPATPKTSHVRLPFFLNNFFIFLLQIESKLIHRINFPFGTSIIVVAKKYL